MRIAQTQDFIKLREDGYQKRDSKETKVAIELANDIFSEATEREQPFLYHTPETWARKWLPSRRFTLMRLPLNAAAMPCEPKGDNLVLKKIHAMETKPIVVDYNRNQVGKTMHGFVPQIIVIDGKHRFKAAALRGETHIMAWVGELAIESMHALGGGGPAPERTTAAPGAKLVAQGSSRQEHRLANNTGTWAGGLVKYPQFKNAAAKLKELNVKKKLAAGGPGSGRHKTFFDLNDKATGNNLADTMKSLGYSRDMSRSDSHYTHPDGHEADHVNPNGMVNRLRVHAVGGDPEDHFADIEQKLHERKLVG